MRAIADRCLVMELQDLHTLDGVETSILSEMILHNLCRLKQ